MPTEHPNVVLSRQHFDLMADQYDELFITHMHDYDITHEMILTMLPFPRERRATRPGIGHRDRESDTKIARPFSPEHGGRIRRISRDAGTRPRQTGLGQSPRATAPGRHQSDSLSWPV